MFVISFSSFLLAPFLPARNNMQINRQISTSYINNLHRSLSRFSARKRPLESQFNYVQYLFDDGGDRVGDNNNEIVVVGNVFAVANFMSFNCSNLVVFFNWHYMRRSLMTQCANVRDGSISSSAGAAGQRIAWWWCTITVQGVSLGERWEWLRIDSSRISHLLSIAFPRRRRRHNNNLSSRCVWGRSWMTVFGVRCQLCMSSRWKSRIICNTPGMEIIKSTDEHIRHRNSSWATRGEGLKLRKVLLTWS